VTVRALLALLLTAAPAARADSVVFSNFGAGSSYNTGAGNFIGNGLDGSGSNYAEGDTFTPSAASTVTSLQLALSSYFGTNFDELQVSLANDSGAGFPGAVLASFDVLPGTLGMLGNNNPPVTFSVSPGITLTAGSPYWVTVADISGGADSNIWNWNITGDASSQAISTDGGATWFSPSGLPAGAYAVFAGVAVPEPSAVVLLASGAAGLLASQWRRRRKTRQTKNRPHAEELEGRVVLSTTFSWTQANFAPFGVGTMLQYPNGSIMMEGGADNQTWNVVVPSSTGSYVNNSVPFLYPMNFSRLYLATDVLPNGNIFALGGEYSSAGSETPTGEMFVGPDNGSGGTGWTNIASFPQPTFGDDPSMLLNDGLILLGTGSTQGYPYTSTALTYLYNPTSSAITAMVNGAPQSIAPGTYSTGIPKFWNETNVEEGWVKIPNGDVVSYDLWVSNFFGPSSGGFGELFNPGVGEWQEISPGDGTANGFIPALSAPTDPISGKQWDEMGPGVLLNNGNVFFIGGGTSNTALYNPTTNTWSSGPTIPFPFTADDAPAAVVPNGDVIFTADAALATGQYTGPTAFFDYSPGAGTITALTGSNSPNDFGLAYGSYPNRMLMLPTGQLMFSDQNSGETWVGTPSGGPLPQWRPVVTGISGSGGVYTLTGLRLNGMNGGAAYGDDAQMDENYPIVRFTNSAGSVYYATTSNWSNLGVATGNMTETVTVSLPSGMPAGNYSLLVSGAGINSFPVAFHLPTSVPGVTHTGRMGAIGTVGESSGSQGIGNLLHLQTPVASGRTAGMQPLAPSPADFSDSELGALPTVFSGPIGSTLDNPFTASGSTPASFANGVDALFAGDELAWFTAAVVRVKPAVAART